MGGLMSGSTGTWQVSALIDDELPRYIVAHRAGDKPWLATWERRHQLASPLARWLCTVAEPPAERPLLGRAVGLPRNLAIRLARFRIQEIVRLAGGWPTWLCNRPPARRRLRPVMRVSDGRLFPSLETAAIAEGVTGDAMVYRILKGEYVDA